MTTNSDSHYKNETGTFQVPLNHKAATDGKKLTLFYQRWIPTDNNANNPDRNLVLHHGFGEHSDRYTNVLMALVGTGITVYSFDVRGHGRSQGKQGLAEDVYQLADDLQVFLEFLEQEFKVTKPILYGHSMGGATVLAHIGRSSSSQDKIKAVVATGPALGVDKNCYQTVVGGLLTCLKSVVPSLCLDAGLDTNKLSHDKAVVEAYKADPMTHGMISVSLAFSLLEDGQKRIIPSAKNVTLPIFLGHGEKDVSTDPNGTKDYYQNCASQQKTLQIYPGLLHEIHNELEEDKQKCLADIRKFIMDNL